MLWRPGSRSIRICRTAALSESRAPHSLVRHVTYQEHQGQRDGGNALQIRRCITAMVSATKDGNMRLLSEAVHSSIGYLAYDATTSALHGWLVGILVKL